MPSSKAYGGRHFFALAGLFFVHGSEFRGRHPYAAMEVSGEGNVIIVTYLPGNDVDRHTALQQELLGPLNAGGVDLLYHSGIQLAAKEPGQMLDADAHGSADVGNAEVGVGDVFGNESAGPAYQIGAAILNRGGRQLGSHSSSTAVCT